MQPESVPFSVQISAEWRLNAALWLEQFERGVHPTRFVDRPRWPRNSLLRRYLQRFFRNSTMYQD